VPRRSPRRLLALAVCCAAGARPCAAQVEAGLDAAASYVRYEGFLGSGAASLSPSLAWRSPRTTLAARGTFLVFESGNASLQGLLTAGTFSPALGPLRVEAQAEAGASSYVGFAHFAHALGSLRLHALGGRWGAWAGPLLGSVAHEGSGAGAAGVAAGAWMRWPAGALEVIWSRVTVGDTAYSDVQARARWHAGALEVEGTLGARTAIPGGGASAYGDVSLVLGFAGPVALIATAGRYPGDPVSGSIPGRYVTAGLRLSPRHPAAARPTLAVPAPARTATPAASGAATVEERDGLAVLVVTAGGARRVELMGDFTGWQAVDLAPGADGRWRYAPGLPAGMYRFNVRVDGGPWAVPDGVATAADEFGGRVGVLVVP